MLGLMASFLILMILVIWAYNSMYMAWFRRRGVYPEKGKESEEWVDRLLSEGRVYIAARCYRAYSGAGLKDAVEYVKSKIN